MTTSAALALGSAAAAANLAGAFAVTRSARFGLRFIETVVAFAAGFMLVGPLAAVCAMEDMLVSTVTTLNTPPVKLNTA